MHAAIQKLEGFVWEMCVKSLQILNLQCSVFLHLSVDEMFGTVQISLHDRKIIFCGPRRKQ